MLVAGRVTAAADRDPEVAPPAAGTAAPSTKRPTLSTTPPKLKFGKAKEDQAAQYRAWLLKTHPKLDPKSPAVQRMVEAATQEVQSLDGEGLQIYARGYEIKAGKFNECQAMAEAAYAVPAPRDYQDALVDYYAWGLIDQRWSMDAEAEKATLAAIAPSDNVVRLKPGERLRPRVAKAFPGLAKCTPLMRKLAFDYIAEINPNLDAQGWYRSATAEVKEPDEHAILPLDNGRFQVSRYVIRPDSPILIPAPASLARAANPDRVNLRGSWISDLSALDGLTPADLDISRTQIRDISGLAKMNDLRRLSIAGLPVADLSPLAGLPLEALDISDTRVTDLSAVKALRLKEFRLARTAVSDLGPLRGMPLKVLSIEQTDVADLSPLAGMQLIYLNFDVTPARDLSPLAGMPLREVLYAPGRYRGEPVLREIETLRTIGFVPGDEWRQEYDRKYVKRTVVPGIELKETAGEDDLGLDLD